MMEPQFASDFWPTNSRHPTHINSSADTYESRLILVYYYGVDSGEKEAAVNDMIVLWFDFHAVL